MPAAGSYVYAQKGTEQLCSQTACATPRPLPDTMTATIARPGSAAIGERAVFELRIATGRLLRLSTGFDQNGVRMDELYGELTEAGITQSAVMRPDPPLQLLKLPFRKGDRWSGTFTDGNDKGTYRFDNAGRETINAAGKRVQAWRITGTVNVEGESEGSAALSLWLDPQSNMVLRIAGTLDIGTSFTRYKAQFTDTLRGS